MEVSGLCTWDAEIAVNVLSKGVATVAAEGFVL